MPLGFLLGNSARKKAKNAGKDRQRIVQIQNRQAKRQFLNQFRQVQAQSVLGNIASLGGGYQSSRGAGEAVSLNAQLETALEEMATMERLSETAGENAQDAARLQFAGSVINSITGFAMSDAGQSFLSGFGRGPSGAVGGIGPSGLGSGGPGASGVSTPFK